MTRVMKPGGIIMVASPNRLFPLDAFHGRAPGSYRPRPFNPFTDRFLLSVGDYRAMFLESGCSRTDAQPVRNYWGFLRSRKSLKGWLAGIPMRFLFALVSHPALKPLRGSPLNPWICVLARKAGA